VLFYRGLSGSKKTSLPKTEGKNCHKMARTPHDRLRDAALSTTWLFKLEMRELVISSRMAERGKNIKTGVRRDKTRYSASWSDLNNQVEDSELKPEEKKRDCAVGPGRSGNQRGRWPAALVADRSDNPGRNSQAPAGDLNTTIRRSGSSREGSSSPITISLNIQLELLPGFALPLTTL
jgi:hypothetical protein